MVVICAWCFPDLKVDIETTHSICQRHYEEMMIELSKLKEVKYPLFCKKIYFIGSGATSPADCRGEPR